jgi:cell division protein FtsB
MSSGNKQNNIKKVSKSAPAPKAKKSKRSRSYILTVAVIAITAYFIIMLIQVRVQINTKKTEVEKAQAQYEQTVEKNDELKQTLTQEDDSKYMERVARDVLGYAYPGERVYYDISSGK